MIISNNKKFIFVHIHKCAGTTISFAMEPFLGEEDIICGGTPRGELFQQSFMERHGLYKHSKASEIRSFVGKDTWNTYFTFSIVRNPVNRATSLYSYIQTVIDTVVNKKKSKAPLSWPLTKAYLGSDSFAGFIRHEQFLKDPGARPQYESLSEEGGDCLLVDFVGKVENLDRDVKEIVRRIGIKDVKLEKHNVSKSENRISKEELSPEDLEYLFRLYHKDFEIFNYEPRI